MPAIASLPLNAGGSIPQIGLGVWQVSDEEVARAVPAALEAGYRSIDTAAIYRNEAAVGAALAKASVPRADIFLTTKLWNEAQGYDSALRALDESLHKLRTDAVDLYLIHWAAPQRGAYVESWKALIAAREAGKAKAIGVSNFHPAHLDRIIGETGVTPAVNQIELHPLLQQAELRAYHARAGIVTEAWSPLGQGRILENEALAAIAKRLGRSVAQVILRWHLQLGTVAIPKSVTPSRIRENIAVADFTLSDEDMAAIGRLDAGRRFGPDPDVFG